jgi:ubiquinone/menaquinone biosynthesis C-methylase UbiE
MLRDVCAMPLLSHFPDWMVAMTKTDAIFAGSIPALYDKYLGPLIFEPYADDLAERLSSLSAGRVLETAAGSGIVTRALLRSLPTSVSVVATDLNQAMLDHAAAQVSSSRVNWQKVDAQALPFPDDTFDAVVCQFGAMFFPDKQKAYHEARRVLKNGGRFIFNTWDRIENNELADVVTVAMADMFPADPPVFLARTPHGYHDKKMILDELRSAGFSNTTLDTVTRRSVASTCRDPAIGYCQGTPLRNEIEGRDASRLAEATERPPARSASSSGHGPVGGKIQAHVITASR